MEGCEVVGVKERGAREGMGKGVVVDRKDRVEEDEEKERGIRDCGVLREGS